MSKMGSGRVIRGGQDVAALLQVEGISHGAIEALLSSASASAGFHGSRSMMCFEDFSPGASAVRQLAHRLEMEDMGKDEADEYGLHQPEKKRRLSAEKVEFLEKSFETENRLEPERKLQLARELGLQSRQVAIWFENRRDMQEGIVWSCRRKRTPGGEGGGGWRRKKRSLDNNTPLNCTKV